MNAYVRHIKNNKKMLKLLICLPLILLPLIADTQARDPPAPGSRSRIARFAVAAHNKNTNANLVFVRNLEGKTQSDAGRRAEVCLLRFNKGSVTWRFDSIGDDVMRLHADAYGTY
ncbi:unnamed protein product [Thlaspi arvense]|uniref:Cystatin domain-containing protein n=1 Tax=Thlaspi arvense TaxID=13288 RepID=A0AAU9T3P9_THLAR|nr:unnamed protein product [Thlaspi arvense]